MFKKPFFRFFGALSLVFITLFAFYLLRFILVPFVIGYILHYALKPFVTLLSQRGMKHKSAVITVFSVFFVIVAVFLFLFVPAIVTELSAIQDNLPFYKNALTEKFTYIEDHLLGKFTAFLPDSDASDEDMKTAVSKYLGDSLMNMMKRVPAYLLNVLPFFLYIFIIPFATFFFLLDEYRIKKILISRVPNRFFETTLNLFHSLNRQFGWLLRGMLTSAVLMSVIISLLLWLIGLEYPILLGIFSGVANLIPYAGPIVGSIAAFIVSLMTGAPNIMFLYIIFVFLVANMIDNLFIQPLVMAKAADLHPLLVIFLVLVGSRYGGVLGMLICVPLASLLQVAIRILYRELVRPIRPDFALYRDIDSECSSDA